jgi:hypothetical protein
LERPDIRTGAGCTIRQYLAHMLQCDLRLGLEADIIRHTPAMSRRAASSAHSFGRYSR